MDTFEAIKQRRSLKHYDPSHQISEQEIKQLLELTLLSPTSFNMQNWRFLLVKNPEIRQKIRSAAFNQAQVTDASILVVVCADLKAWSKDPARYWKNTPAEVQKMIVPMIKPFYEGNDEIQRDEAMRSCGIAAQTLMLSAKAMGYDTCPMIGFDPTAVAEIINLPEDHVIGLMISVGKASKPAWDRSGKLDFDEVVFYDQF